MLPTVTSDLPRQAVGSGSVLYHCDVSGLKISTAAVYFDDNVYPPATTSADWRLKTPGENLAVGMGGIGFHFFDLSSYVYTSLVPLKSLFFTPPAATNLPLT